MLKYCAELYFTFGIAFGSRASRCEAKRKADEQRASCGSRSRACLVRPTPENCWHGRQSRKHFHQKNRARKKMYGITPENNIAHPAGDFRTPHEKHIHFGSCTWSRGVFLGNESDELDSASWQRQGFLAGSDGSSGSGRSDVSSPEERLAAVRNASYGSCESQTCTTDSEIQERTNLSVSAE